MDHNKGSCKWKTRFGSNLTYTNTFSVQRHLIKNDAVQKNDKIIAYPSLKHYMQTKRISHV